MIDVDPFTIRIFLHLLAVTVWVGGQIVLAALLPVIRKLGPEAPGAVARQFAFVAWPFYALLVGTGIWNLLSIDFTSRTFGYQLVFFIKLILVALSGLAAWGHTRASSSLVKGITGGGAAVTAVGAFTCGVLMVT
ncbi:MAG TPA: hypothetical protein ENI86_17425 [Acidimicrobiales bacterium]|nr:hypothetical protein [Acidimicrobiales bacterium]